MLHQNISKEHNALFKNLIGIDGILTFDDENRIKVAGHELGDIDITNGKIEITNISGENAIADIVLIRNKR